MDDSHLFGGGPYPLFIFIARLGSLLLLEPQ